MKLLEAAYAEFGLIDTNFSKLAAIVTSAVTPVPRRLFCHVGPCRNSKRSSLITPASGPTA